MQSRNAMESEDHSKVGHTMPRPCAVEIHVRCYGGGSFELSCHRYVTPPAVASVYMGLGDNDRAFAWLEKAYQERSNYLAYLNVFPGVDSLRADPRFQDLVRRIGLTQ
jgi:hypothetical protein